MRKGFLAALTPAKTFLAGLAIAWYATVFATAATFALIPVASQAQTSPGATACFTPTECIQDQGQQAETGRNCTDTQPCCSTTRCYYQDLSCGPNQGKCLAKYPSAKLTVAIGSTTTVTDLSDYIGVVYRYSVSIAGLIAGIMIMIGGLQYLVARGDAGRVTKAKERISNAIIGLVLVLGAYLLLQTVNPDLVLLRLPKIPVVKPVVINTCTATELCFPCGTKYGIIANTQQEKTQTPKGCKDARLTTNFLAPNITFTCTGKGCPGAQSGQAGFAGCSDALFNCRAATDPQKTAECGTGPGGTTGAAAAAVQAGERMLCQKCTADGERCDSSKPELCCTGFCSASGACTPGQLGGKCNSNNDCKSKICSAATVSFGKSCTSGTEGSPCSGDGECSQGTICRNDELFTYRHNYNKRYCSSGTYGSPCSDDRGCASPNVCRGIQGLAQTICIDPSGGVGCVDGECNDGESCVGDGKHGFCSKRTPGSYCQKPVDCLSQKCVNDRCSDGAEGTICNSGADCNSEKCIAGTDYKFCISGSTGSACTGDTDCLTDFKCLIGTGLKVGRCILRN